MWWGGFSEAKRSMLKDLGEGLNPHVVGRFFRVFAVVCNMAKFES